MRRPSSIEPFTPSPTVTLHPLLQSVLDNLDIQIDEELTRYRRQRRYPDGGNRTRTLSPSALSSPASGYSAAKPNGSAKSFDLKFAGTQSTGVSPSSTAIGILNNTIQRPTPRSSIYAEAPAPENLAENLAENPSISEVRPLEPNFRAAVGQAAVSNSARRSVESPTRPPIQSSTAPSIPLELEPPARISSYAEQNDLSVYAPNDTLQKLMQRTEAQPNEAPEDYLASSEELLRSIAEEDVELRAEREPNSMLETLLTPLGIGSMLLLLLSSTTLGYVMMNPSSLGWWKAAQSPSPASPSASSSDGQDGTAPSPDLASEEFIDLGLDTLSTLPKPAVQGNATTAKPKASTATKPTASSPATPSEASNKATSGATSPSIEPPVFDSIPVAPVPQPSLSTVVVPSEPPIVEAAPEPAYQPAAPAPLPPVSVSPEPITATPPALEPAPEAVTATAPTHSAPANPENYYYVVTEYSGDSSLQEARGAVPDAYVRNLPEAGAKVQMGAFSDEARAQELLQELENQGIEAEVYQP